MKIKDFFSRNKKYILIFLSGILLTLIVMGIFFFVIEEKDQESIEIDVREVEKRIEKAGKVAEAEQEKKDIEEQEQNNTANENVSSSNSMNGSNSYSGSGSFSTNQGGSSASNNDVVNYFLEQEHYASGAEQDPSLRERLKSGVSTINQFLFHGGTIRGKTFHELSSSAKLQVLKIALSIDSKIDEHFPNYKENIKQGASNLKAKVIVTYLETTNKICTNYEDVCAQAREDFKTMKNSFKISFSLIAGVAKEGGAALKEWYLSTK